jgi:hypothetical protein
MPESQIPNPVEQKQPIILIHGIRTHAPWMDEIKQTLRKNGFVVEATSYGWYGLFGFLTHSKKFEEQAVQRVLDDIQDATQLHSPHLVSVIAHSFGTYVFSKILLQQVGLKWNRIIFCGSIVEDDFPFREVRGRFSVPLLNEVGGRDLWPAIAAKIGYGGVGSYGFNRPGVETRRHPNFKHSDFLTPEFAATWVDFLRGGDPRPVHETVLSGRRRVVAQLIFVSVVIGAILTASYFAFQQRQQDQQAEEVRALQAGLCRVPTGDASGMLYSIDEFFLGRGDLRFRYNLSIMKPYPNPITKINSMLSAYCPPGLESPFEVGFFSNLGEVSSSKVRDFQVLLRSALAAMKVPVSVSITGSMDAQTRVAITAARKKLNMIASNDVNFDLYEELRKAAE